MGAFADLPGIVVPDKTPAEYRLEDVVAERVLDDLALEVDSKDEPLLGLVDFEGVVRAEGVLAPLKALGQVDGALNGLHAVAHGCRVVSLSAAGFLIGGV